ncbi:MAG TPA: methylmalonyl Co-A mutase-associated GTPase MeaB [Nitrososphaerales archaeon]|nr:methylmalonyl Co-A mutase-associated GTPase MeaB [Nitrososphaerales archaeon]
MGQQALLNRVLKGDRQALARAISVVEAEGRDSRQLLSGLKHTGGAFVLGLTGPPGTGKSTLVDRLIELYRKQGLRVGVVAVDPTSPITGGALLGDRIRMTRHTNDPDVFIRSMASRGWSGGLARTTAQVIQLMDAAGFDLILLETVGIGQSDIEVVGVAHAVVVVLTPGLGDDIQVSKAGLMEIGDIYAVNKGDLEGADSMVVSILSMVRDLKSRSPPVLKVSALKGEGLDSLVLSIDRIRARFNGGDPELRLKSLKGMMLEMAKGDVLERFTSRAEAKAQRLAKDVLAGKLSLSQAASMLEK